MEHKENYHNLANMIIQIAAMDYRKAYKNMLKHNRQCDIDTVNEVEAFFNSPLAGVLTDLDLNYVLDRIRREVRARR